MPYTPAAWATARTGAVVSGPYGHRRTGAVSLPLLRTTPKQPDVPLLPRYPRGLALALRGGPGESRQVSCGQRQSFSGVNACFPIGGSIYVNSVSGAKMYQIKDERWASSEGVAPGHAAENAQLFPVVHVGRDTLAYRSYTATGFSSLGLPPNTSGPDQSGSGPRRRGGNVLGERGRPRTGRCVPLAAAGVAAVCTLHAALYVADVRGAARVAGHLVVGRVRAKRLRHGLPERSDRALGLL
jgi:hypothetical protein